MIYIPYLLYKIDQKYKKSEVCFGFNYYEGYKFAIENFSIAYFDLGIQVSLKFHIVFENVMQFCEKHNSGLRLYSENSLENSHYDFKPFWQKSYKVSMNHPNYVDKMLKSVHMYNVLHALIYIK